MRLTVSALFAFMLFISAAGAQVTTGAISGTVADASGAEIGRAHV